MSGFAILEIPEYTFEEFTEIAVTKLRLENVGVNSARFIAEKVWSELGAKDIRDVIKISRLSRSSEDVSFVVKMLKKK